MKNVAIDTQSNSSLQGIDKVAGGRVGTSLATGQSEKGKSEREGQWNKE
jgi:hypothetical protein